MLCILAVGETEEHVDVGERVDTGEHVDRGEQVEPDESLDTSGPLPGKFWNGSIKDMSELITSGVFGIVEQPCGNAATAV